MARQAPEVAPGAEAAPWPEPLRLEAERRIGVAPYPPEEASPELSPERREALALFVERAARERDGAVAAADAALERGVPAHEASNALHAETREVLARAAQAAPGLGMEAPELQRLVLERAEAMREERERHAAALERMRQAMEEIEEEARATEEQARAAALARERAAFVEAAARAYDAGMSVSEMLEGLVPARDALAPRLAVAAALEARVAEGAARLGLGEDELVGAMVVRVGALRAAREAGTPEGMAEGRAAQRAALEAFAEANARSWDKAVWKQERADARAGLVGGCTGADEPDSPEARKRAQIAARVERAVPRLGASEAALWEAIEWRAHERDQAARSEREAAVAAIWGERERARQEAEARVLRQAAEQAAQRETERAAQQEQAERERAEERSREALRELAAGLRSWGWNHLDAEGRAALRMGLDAHLERVVGPEGVARLDRGDHAALAGVLEGAEDRVVLTQARLLEAGERLGREDLLSRGRGLFPAIIAAQIADEEAELERGRGRRLGRDLGDDYDDGLEM